MATVYLDRKTPGTKDDPFLDSEEGNKKTKKSRFSSACIKNRKRYQRACRQLGLPPLSRLMKQLGKTAIDMKSEGLKDKDVNAICAALLNHSNIDVLNLGDNSLEPMALTYIARLLNKNTIITELNLSDNRLGHGAGNLQGVRMLSEITKPNKNLKTLNVSGNRINDGDAADLSNLIKTSPNLWELNLSHNELREKGGMHVGDAIRANDTLYSLDLSWNHLRGRGAECVALGLMNNTNLTKLNLAWNGFGLEGCSAMTCALRKNTCLTELDMSSNRIYATGAWELWKGVMDNKTLRVIKIGQNPLQSVCTTPLICMVRDNPYLDLETIDMSGVVVEKDFDVVVDEIHETRPDFTVIYDRSLPVHKQKWENFLANKDKPVFNVDPVRILFYAKKNLRVIDMFNKIDVDGDALLTKQEVHRALKMENFEMSASAIDAIFDYLDADGNGTIDLGELYSGERRLKRRVLGEAKAQYERSKLDVEKGDKDGLRSDMGGLGGRFSKTYRPDLAQGSDTGNTLRAGSSVPSTTSKRPGHSPLPPIKQ